MSFCTVCWWQGRPASSSWPVRLSTGRLGTPIFPVSVDALHRDTRRNTGAHCARPASRAGLGMEPFHFDPNTTALGTVFTHAGEELLTLSLEDRLSHCHVLGKTGHGKSVLLTNTALQDIYAGRGIAIFDPHGDMSSEILQRLPSWRSRDLVYIDPNDTERVVSINLVDNVPPDRVDFVAASIVGTFKAIYGESWGPRLERILYASVAALIECPGTSLVGLGKLLKSETYRAQVLRHVRNPVVRDFFVTEYDQWDPKYRQQNIESVLNKVEQLFASDFLRATFGATRSSIDFSDIMDNRKIVVANLSTGVLGELHSRLLGAMLIAGFAQAALSRAAIEEHLRTPFFLIVDEAQHFSNEVFCQIFSELRKQKLGAILAHQYIHQLPDYLSAALTGNVGCTIAFELSADDAKAIAPEIGLKNPDSLVDQGPGEAWLRHPRYGGPFHPRLLAPLKPTGSGRDAALKQNRLRHTFPRARVRDAVTRFLGHPSLPEHA